MKGGFAETFCPSQTYIPHPDPCIQLVPVDIVGELYFREFLAVAVSERWTSFAGQFESVC